MTKKTSVNPSFIPVLSHAKKKKKKKKKKKEEVSSAESAGA